MRLVALLLTLAACAGPTSLAVDATNLDAAADAAPDAPIADVRPSGWRAEPRLPAVWQEIAGAVVDGRLYVLGGFEAGRPTDRVRAWDPARGRWEDAPSLPAQLHHIAAAAVGGDLYALGGYLDFSFSPVSACYVLRRGARAWEAVAALPEPRGAAVAGAIDGRVVVAGGYGVASRLLTRVAIYDPRADRWTAGADMPTAREHVAGFVHGGRLWVLGGRLGTLASNLAVVEAYDPASDRWDVALPPMRMARGGFAAAALDGVAYAIGGEQPDRALAEVEALDLTTLRWRDAPPLPTPRHGFVALTAGGRVWAIGGGDRPTFAPTDAVESYAP